MSERVVPPTEVVRTLHGVRIATTVWSSAPLATAPASTPPHHDVVLLHGTGLTADDWSDVARGLSRDHTVHAVDLRGHGRSEWPGTYSIDLMAPFGVAGWYAEPGWAKPGWPGASILAGHINRRSPRLELDTFGHLTRVRAGDRITVAYTSGESVTFTATKSRAVSKKAVPRDDSIWDSGNPQPVLRLITCDPETPVKGGHYEGNWVVWASLA